MDSQAAESRAEFELNNCSPKIPKKVYYMKFVKAQGFAFKNFRFYIISHQA